MEGVAAEKPSAAATEKQSSTATASPTASPGKQSTTVTALPTASPGKQLPTAAAEKQSATATASPTAAPEQQSATAAAKQSSTAMAAQAIASDETAATRLPVFNVVEANTLIAKNDWKGLEDYLSSFVGNFVGRNSQNVHMMHPGLFLIPREKIFLGLLHVDSYEEGSEFFNKSLKVLLKCETKFRPLDLEQKIEYLSNILEKRSVPTNSNEGVDTAVAVADYIQLYFPSAISRNEAGYEELQGIWQFAMKLPVLDTLVSTEGKAEPQCVFRCLACGWDGPGKKSISAMRYHIIHLEKTRGCPRVTQDMLDRLKATDEGKVVPDMSTLADRLKNKRKASSSSAASQKVTPSPSSTEKFIGALNSSSLSIHTSNKRPKVGSSPLTADTVMSLPSATSPLPHGLNPKFLSQSATTLRSICNTLLDQIDTCVVASAQDYFVKKLLELMQVGCDLQLASAKASPVSSIEATSVPGQESQSASQKAPAQGGSASEAKATEDQVIENSQTGGEERKTSTGSQTTGVEQVDGGKTEKL